MKRLFTFGCSYTLYAWPTWADMLGLDYDEHHNWGLPGLGNRAIAERVAEAHARHNITSNDVVIIQWSSHLRNDFWHKYSLPDRAPGWKTAGSVFNFINEKLYDEKWINTFFYEPAFFMHTLNNILLTQGLLNSLGCNWFMTSIGDLRNLGMDMRVNSKYGEQGNITNPYDANVDQVAWVKIPEMSFYNKSIWEDYADRWLMPLETFSKQYPELTYEYYDDSHRGSKKTEVDLHPSPMQYVNWLTTEVKDKLPISDKTLSNSKKIAEVVDNHYKKTNFSKAKFALELMNKDFFKDSVSEFIWPKKNLGF